MKNRVVLVSALLASTCMVALAQGLTGSGPSQRQGRNGDQTQTLMLKSSGMNLTGSLDPGNGMAVEITEGMIHDTDVSFKVTRMGRDGNPQVTTYKGTLEGDDLKLTPTREGGGGKGGGRRGQELGFKRAK